MSSVWRRMSSPALPSSLRMSSPRLATRSETLSSPSALRHVSLAFSSASRAAFLASALVSSHPMSRTSVFVGLTTPGPDRRAAPLRPASRARAGKCQPACRRSDVTPLQSPRGEEPEWLPRHPAYGLATDHAQGGWIHDHDE